MKESLVNYPYYSTVKLLVDVNNVRQLPDYLPKLRASIAHMVRCIDEIRRKLPDDEIAQKMLAEHRDARHLYACGMRLLRNHRVAYRGYVIEYIPPPIPLREHDYRFTHQDYDGPEDRRCGTGSSIDDCRRQIDALESLRGAA